MAPVLVCRTAWMDLYEGSKGDSARGGGAYVEERGFGGEIFNFLPYDDGVYRGYVRPPGQGAMRNQGIHIERLGADAGDDHIDGVTVIWVATHPVKRGTRIVGWYEGARVHRRWSPSPQKRKMPNGVNAGFMISARTAHRLAPDDRTFVLPRASQKATGIGQSNVWYPPPKWAARLLAYKEGLLSPRERSIPRKAPRTPDTDERLRIEKAAVDATIAWCEDRGMSWRDVSLQRRGWDLEAGHGPETLRIEVKGTSRAVADVLVELTPNEFAQMEKHRESYRLSIVEVGKKRRKLQMFAWSGDVEAWISGAGDRELLVRKIVSARVEVQTRT